MRNIDRERGGHRNEINTELSTDAYNSHKKKVILSYSISYLQFTIKSTIQFIIILSCLIYILYIYIFYRNMHSLGLH